MSNKKLFWIAFFILSCCEFGQMAYSKNISATPESLNSSGSKLQCYDEKVPTNCPHANGTLTSNLLPR